MTWNLVFFLLALLLSALMLSVLTVQINGYEQKLNQLIKDLDERYNLEALRQRLAEEKRIQTENAKKRLKGGKA